MTLVSPDRLSHILLLQAEGGNQQETGQPDRQGIKTQFIGEIEAGVMTQIWIYLILDQHQIELLLRALIMVHPHLVSIPTLGIMPIMLLNFLPIPATQPQGGECFLYNEMVKNAGSPVSNPHASKVSCFSCLLASRK